jgi:hypothetical protein
MAQVIECFPSVLEDLSLNASATKKMHLMHLTYQTS